MMNTKPVNDYIHSFDNINANNVKQLNLHGGPKMNNVVVPQFRVIDAIVEYETDMYREESKEKYGDLIDRAYITNDNTYCKKRANNRKFTKTNPEL